MTADTPEVQRGCSIKKDKPNERRAEQFNTVSFTSAADSGVATERFGSASCGGLGKSSRPRAYSMHNKAQRRRGNSQDTGRRNSLPTAVLVENFLAVPGRDMTDKGDTTEGGTDEDHHRRVKSVKDSDRSGRRHEPLRRVRSFKTTSKGLINRGDSFKKKTTSSTGFTVTDSNTVENRDQVNALGFRDPSLVPPIPTVSIDTEHSRGQGSPPYGHFRVLILGTPGVGKSSITDQFMTSEFLGSFDYSISQSEEDRTVTLLVDGDESTLEFLDENDFEDELESFSLDAYVVVYSLTDKSSFDTAADILDQLQQEVGTDKPVILVGNKSDLVRKRKINAEDGRAKADQYNCKYIETSAALNHRIDDLLVGILKQILLKNTKPHNKHELKTKERKGSFKKTKQFLEKIFRRNNTKDRGCENLYVS